MVVLVIAVIGALGVETTSFIAIFGAAGLAVGLALQGSLSNFASGVLIVLFRPYRVGDFIEAAGIAGSVEQVQILTTVLKTGDNKQIIVPNSQIMDSIITNYSANNTRRIDMVIGVGYDDDLDKVRATIKELIEADSRILAEPGGQQRQFLRATVGQFVGLLGSQVRPHRSDQEALRQGRHQLSLPAAGRAPLQAIRGLKFRRRA